MSIVEQPIKDGISDGGITKTRKHHENVENVDTQNLGTRIRENEDTQKIEIEKL